MSRRKWVLLAYRLPREPSTPRIAVWRKLKHLGAVQVLDGLVALPHSSRNQEQFEWLADTIGEAGGESSIWMAEVATASQQRAVEEVMSTSVAQEYRSLLAQAEEVQKTQLPYRTRHVKRLRRELRRIQARDYFQGPYAEHAQAAIERLVIREEVAP